MTDQQTTPSSGISAPEETVPQVRGQDTSKSTAKEDAPRKQDLPWFKKRHIVVPSGLVLLAGVVLVSTSGYAKFFDVTTGVGAKVDAAPKAAPATATIGQSVRDGEFSFVVTSVQRPTKTLTDRSRRLHTAAGVFVVVRVNVSNIGHAPKTLTSTDQFLVSSKGQRFATSAAISSLKDADKVFLDKVNPGHTVNAPLLFDVPAGSTVASVELHDSLSSTGVQVKLR